MTAETIGELNISIENLAEKLDAHIENSKENNEKLLDMIQELTRTCDLTLQQALKTNGRMNVVEPLALDYQEKRANFKGAVMLITVMGGAILGGTFLLGKLYIDKTERDITDGVVMKLEAKYNVKINE